MANIYPPIIDRSLPPVIKQINGNDIKYILNIPFQHNIFIENHQTYINVKINGISSNNQNAEKIITINPSDIINDNLISKKINNSENFSLNEGQFYKIQLAYADSSGNTTSAYSTIGTLKCIKKSEQYPKVIISYLEENKNEDVNKPIRCMSTRFEGKYRNIDTAEKVIAYEFNVYDSNKNLYATSGRQIHESFLENKDNIIKIDENTIILESTDVFLLNKTLHPNKYYWIEYIVYTVNGLTESSIQYHILDDNFIRPDIAGFIQPKLNYENGCIEVNLQPSTVPAGAQQQSSTGAYKLLRASSKDNYSSWTEILHFQLVNQIPDLHLWDDFTIEQGIYYKYAIQQYDNNDLTSARLISTAVYADFEDVFLFDGEKQLKIKYDPKIDNFKTVSIENKVDTIGGKFPFLSKNGNTNYKSFSLSGLITTFADSSNMFSKNTTPYIYSWDLNSETIEKERKFKLDVLNWLNNGKPKLFKSPTEGNYIVILQGVTLIPKDQLGRMLHNFSATAYEICDYTMDYLTKYNIFTGKDIEANDYHLESIVLKDITTSDTNESRYRYKENNKFIYKINFHNYLVHDLVAKDLPPDTILKIIIQNDNVEEQIFYIGKTHSLNLNGIENIKGIEIQNISQLEHFELPDINNTASIDISYQLPTKKTFKNLLKLETEIIYMREVCGKGDGIWLIGGEYFLDNNDNPYTSLLESETTVTNQLNEENYQKTTVLNIDQLMLRIKDIDANIYYTNTNSATEGEINDINFYLSRNYNDNNIANILKNPIKIYQAIDNTNTLYYYSYYLDKQNGQDILKLERFSNIDFRARINNHLYKLNDIIITENNNFIQKDLEGIVAFWIGNGVVADLGYPSTTATYITKE